MRRVRAACNRLGDKFDDRDFEGGPPIFIFLRGGLMRVWRNICGKFGKNIRKTLQKKKNNVHGTHGGSETSLNTVAHENVKVYMNQYVNFFLKFP